MKKSYTFFCLLLLYSLLFTSCTSDELLKISDEHILLRAGVCYSVPGMYKSDLRGESVEILERDEYGRSLISCVAENFITGKSEKVFVIFQSHEKSKINYYEDINYIFDDDSDANIDDLKQKNDWNQPLNLSQCSMREIRVSLDNHLVRDSIFENFDDKTFYESLQKNHKISKDEVKNIFKCDSDGSHCELYSLILKNDEKYFCIVDSFYNVFCTRITSKNEFSNLLIDLKDNSGWNN